MRIKSTKTRATSLASIIAKQAIMQINVSSLKLMLQTNKQSVWAIFGQ